MTATRTRKLHAPKPRGATYNKLLTMCELPQRRRYLRHPDHPQPVNCRECVAALRTACAPEEFALRSGIFPRGPHDLPMRKCRRCGEVDEFTSESEAFGVCATCMDHANRPERP